jgi:predicted nucleic acid-binding protein
MGAFDADVLIYAASPGHVLGVRVLALFRDASPSEEGQVTGVGSTLLLPELLTRPTLDGPVEEVATLAGLLARLDLRPVDGAIASLAVTLGAAYRLRTVDAVHLATAVAARADRFITNNSREFPRSIKETPVTYTADLE